MNNFLKKRTLVLLSTTSIFISCVNKVDNKQDPLLETVVEVTVDFAKPDYTTSTRPRPQLSTDVESTHKSKAPTTSYTYKIVNKKESSLKLHDNQELKKMTYTVEIQKELSKSALDEIANVIAYSEPCEYIFIEYYLSTQVKNGPNYGLSKRTPTEQSSQINYIAPPAKESVAVKKPYDGCKVFGKWSMMGATVIVYQKGDNCYMVNHYGGSKYDEPERYIKTTFRGCTAFKNAEDLADVYVINNNGDLDGYYEGYYASTFPKAL